MAPFLHLGFRVWGSGFMGFRVRVAEEVSLNSKIYTHLGPDTLGLGCVLSEGVRVTLNLKWSSKALLRTLGTLYKA